MSFPYPQDRHAERKTKGEHPYKDEKELMTQQDATLQAQTEAYGEARRDESEDERDARIAAEAEERFRQIGDEVADRGEGVTAPGQPD